MRVQGVWVEAELAKVIKARLVGGVQGLRVVEGAGARCKVLKPPPTARVLWGVVVCVRGAGRGMRWHAWSVGSGWRGGGDGRTGTPHTLQLLLNTQRPCPPPAAHPPPPPTAPQPTSCTCFDSGSGDQPTNQPAGRQRGAPRRRSGAPHGLRRAGGRTGLLRAPSRGWGAVHARAVQPGLLHAARRDGAARAERPAQPHGRQQHVLAVRPAQPLPYRHGQAAAQGEWGALLAGGGGAGASDAG